MMTEVKTIAVDFDGTIVEHAYPEIGREMLFAIDTLKELKKRGHRIILWSHRHGKYLDDAVEFCRNRGLEFYAVNKNHPDEIWDENTPRKILADIYIDDRNVGGFPGWSEIWQMLHPEGGDFEHILRNPQAHYNYNKEKKSFFKKLFGLE